MNYRLETTKLLIENGANYNAQSKYGDDALQTACLKGATEIFNYLISVIPYVAERLANAHELLGSTFLDEHNDLYTMLKHWRIAQRIRESTPSKYVQWKEKLVINFYFLTRSTFETTNNSS